MLKSFLLLKLSILALIVSAGVTARASEIDFLNNPSRVEINNGGSQEISSAEPLLIKYDQSRVITCS